MARPYVCRLADVGRLALLARHIVPLLAFALGIIPATLAIGRR
jgi:hypothetical protein